MPTLRIERDMLLFTCIVNAEYTEVCQGKDGGLSIWLPICVSGSVQLAVRHLKHP